MTTDDNPYASPAAEEPRPHNDFYDEDDDDDDRPAIKHPYVSAHGRATATAVLLSICLLITGASLVSSVSILRVLESVRQGEFVTEEQANAIDSRHVSLLIIGIGCRVVTIVAFFMWFHRVHRNLPALRAERLEYSPAWAIGGWFVPILNLGRPYQVMREVQRESDPARIAPLGPPAGTTLIGWWWGAFLITEFLVQLNMQIQAMPMDLPEQIGMVRFDILVDVLVIIAGVLAILVVRGIDRAQTERSLKLLQLRTEMAI